MQWNKLCKLNKFKESDHHRSLITYDDLDYDYNLTNNNVNNEVKNAYYNKVIQIRKVMDKRNKDNQVDMRKEIKKINEKIEDLSKDLRKYKISSD